MLEKPKRVTIGFFATGDTILYYKGYAKPIASSLHFEVTNDAVLWFANAENWKIIEEQEPKLHELVDKEKDLSFRKLIEFSIIRDIYNAKERYNIFMQTRPYANELPDNVIATFLRMDATTISNIKKENWLENRQKHLENNS